MAEIEPTSLVLASRKIWVLDHEASVCQCCYDTSFGLLTRRHHCRVCGIVVCSSCSMNRLASYPGVRICNMCYEAAVPSARGTTANARWTQRLDQNCWYHGSITVHEAEVILRPLNAGHYLVRKVEEREDFRLYAISVVRTLGKVSHYLVKEKQGVFSTADERVLRISRCTLKDLIGFYTVQPYAAMGIVQPVDRINSQGLVGRSQGLAILEPPMCPNCSSDVSNVISKSYNASHIPANIYRGNEQPVSSTSLISRTSLRPSVSNKELRTPHVPQSPTERSAPPSRTRSRANSRSSGSNINSDEDALPEESLMSGVVAVDYSARAEKDEDIEMPSQVPSNYPSDDEESPSGGLQDTETEDIMAISDRRDISKVCLRCERRFAVSLEFCKYCGVPLARADASISPRNWQIDPEQLEINEKLAEGAFGSVHLAVWHRKRDITVVVKQRKNDGSTEEGFLAEANLMTSWKGFSKYVLRLFGICTNSSKHMIILEYAARRDLRRVLQNQSEKKRLSTLWKRRFSSEICAGMKFIHENGIIHNDVAARNVFVTTKWEVKIGDFGLAVQVDDKEVPLQAEKGRRFPFRWCAPEILSHGKIYFTSDVWSFGVLMWEIFSDGSHPYRKQLRKSQMKDIQKVLKSNVRLLRPPKCPDDVYGLMLTCWVYSPEDRPSFQQLAFRLASMYDVEYKTSSMGSQNDPISENTGEK